MIREETISKTRNNLFMGLKNNLMLVVVTLVAVGVRLFLFGHVPPGLNQDEASIGYDAFALLKFGIDRNGFHNPIHLVSWGSGQNALYAYLAMPLIGLFGLTPAAVRAVNLLFGLISLVIFYRLVKKVAGKELAMIAFLLLAVSPWQIMASRWGLESNLFPALFLLAVYLLVLSLERKWWLPLSACCFALSLYAYSTAYFVVPLFLLLIIPYLYRRLKLTTRYLIGSAVVFIIIALPILIFLWINFGKLGSIQTALFSIPRLPGPPRFLIGNSQILRNLAVLGKLLITQNDGFIENQLPYFGFGYLFCLPLVIIGIVKIIRNYESTKEKTENRLPGNYLFLAWIVVALLLALITEVNINRLNLLYYPLIFFAAVGIDALKTKFSWSFRLIIGLIIVSFILFDSIYFTSYQTKAAPAFYATFGEAIDYGAKHSTGPVYITSEVNMPYIFVLFYQRYNPHQFLNTVKYYNRGSEFQYVSSFGRFHFGVEPLEWLRYPAYVIPNSQLGYFSRAQFAIKHFKYYSAVLARTIPTHTIISAADQSYREGLALADSGKTTEAIVKFQEVIRRNPKYTEAYFKLGTIMAKWGRFDDAIYLYSKTLDLKPSNARALLNLGVALAMKGQTNDAMGMIQQALIVQPLYADAYKYLGFIVDSSGRAGEAERQFNEAIRIDPLLKEEIAQMKAKLAKQQNL